MELNYALTENDYLQQQLYLASKNEQIKKQRKLNRILVLVILLIIGFLFYINNILFVAYYFTSASIICFLLFPFYLKKFYRIVFKKYVKANFKNKIGINTTVLFIEDSLEVISKGIGDHRINFSNFKNISEIDNYFFIAFNTGESFMIPKDGIEDVEGLRTKLKGIAGNLKIEFISELDWKWK